MRTSIVKPKDIYIPDSTKKVVNMKRKVNKAVFSDDR